MTDSPFLSLFLYIFTGVFFSEIAGKSGHTEYFEGFFFGDKLVILTCSRGDWVSMLKTWTIQWFFIVTSQSAICTLDGVFTTLQVAFLRERENIKRKPSKFKWKETILEMNSYSLWHNIQKIVSSTFQYCVVWYVFLDYEAKFCFWWILWKFDTFCAIDQDWS